MGRVDPSRRCVQLDLALTDAHAVAAKVTQPAVKTQQATSTFAIPAQQKSCHTAVPCKSTANSMPQERVGTAYWLQLQADTSDY